MNTFEMVVPLICLVGLIICGFGFYRNSWVYKVRMSVLNNPSLNIGLQLYEYNRLMSYKTMFWRWWVWDIEKFKEKRNEI